MLTFLVLSSNNASATTSNTLFSASGTLTDSEKFNGMTIFLPGSKYPQGTSAIAAIPIYNNILGVMGVLETPKLNVNTDAEDTQLDQYREERAILGDDIKFVINPASDMKLDDIKGALYFPITDENLIDNAPVSVYDSQYVDVTTNLIYSYKAQLDNKTVYYYRTPYMPLSCLKLFQAYFRIDFNDGYNNEFGQIRTLVRNPMLRLPTLQIMAQLSTNDNITDYRKVNILTKYGVGHGEYQLSTNNLGNSFNDVEISREINNLILSQDMTIKAWENIKINNVVTNGFKLTLISGGSIDLGEEEFNPDIEMRIDHPIICSYSSMPQQTEAEVANFCSNSEKYNPDFPKRVKIDTTKIKETEGNYKMLAYPNPFTNIFQIEFELETEGETSLVVYDALGRVVETVLMNDDLAFGQHQYQISGENLESGLYYATLQHSGGTQTIKIVKQ